MESFFDKTQKNLAILIDPGKIIKSELRKTIENAHTAKIDYFFVGGSIHTSNQLDSTIDLIREISDIPVILFPGSLLQITAKADATLFMSLISGRNPELLIGHQVLAAPIIKELNLRTISTGYMLIENGHTSSVGYMSNTIPIPREKNEIAIATALAGEMLGLSCIFMDAGSGASKPIKAEMIQQVCSAISIPVVIGGGIENSTQLEKAYEKGANTVVIGNAIESNPDLIEGLIHIRNQFREKLA